MGRSEESRQKILDYLKQCAGQGIPPSVREICAATGIRSTSSVHGHLKALEEMGIISRSAGINRGIHIKNEENSVMVPVIGKVTAGAPILALEEVQGYVAVNESVARGREIFALRIQGLSMVNAGILDNDIIIAEKTQTAENGEIIVALIDDEATVKRFYKENGHFRLQPENPDFSPIIVKEVSVLGKVIYLVRNYE